MANGCSGWQAIMREPLSFLSLARRMGHPFYNGCHGARFSSPTGM
jgi:hypothetical protein